MLGSSTFSVEREGQQNKRGREERQRLGKSEENVEGGCRYDKADEIRKILEKIAMERLRESEGWRKMGEEDGGRGSMRELDLSSSRKIEREEMTGRRTRHSSAKSLDHLPSKRSQGQDIFSTEELLRELSRAADCSSSESSKSERGRRRIPMSRQQSSNKLVTGLQEFPTGYRQDVQVSYRSISSLKLNNNKYLARLGSGPELSPTLMVSGPKVTMLNYYDVTATLFSFCE